ncbi:MAG: hypothetical protein NC048_09940, partial [Bacteroides sp.]|nr:hypothetical protein [Bacteroides sp.]
VTAANSGIIMPTRSLSDGILDDVRISAKEREALMRAYENMRQGKIDAALAKAEAVEKKQLDLIKTPALYDKSKQVSGQKQTDKTEDKTTIKKKKEAIDYKDLAEEQSGKGNKFWKLENGEYVIPGIYRNGSPTGVYKVGIDMFNNATEGLFDVFKSLPGIKKETDRYGKTEYKDGKGRVWVDIHKLKQDIDGAPDESTRQKLQIAFIGYLDDMLKYMETSEAEAAKSALADYENKLKGAKGSYLAYGSDEAVKQGGDEQQGTNRKDLIDSWN